MCGFAHFFSVRSTVSSTQEVSVTKFHFDFLFGVLLAPCLFFEMTAVGDLDLRLKGGKSNCNCTAAANHSAECTE